MHLKEIVIDNNYVYYIIAKLLDVFSYNDYKNWLNKDNVDFLKSFIFREEKKL